jgi:hypothetical protein
MPNSKYLLRAEYRKGRSNSHPTVRMHPLETNPTRARKWTIPTCAPGPDFRIISTKTREQAFEAPQVSAPVFKRCAATGICSKSITDTPVTEFGVSRMLPCHNIACALKGEV